MLSRASLFALNPRQPLAQLYHSSWDARNGLNGSVTALAQTTDGYLWVGTTDGLYGTDVRLTVPGSIIFQTSSPLRQGLPAKMRTLFRMKGQESNLD
jgi:ligand-binding sensor domain-containing protein